ncbi:hypothetical protein MP228_011533 [Amoeboaphelidium protococcarum]|nr:hypothetical protein MP228_011533 [Amoeboaphelidium protococcarum]
MMTRVTRSVAKRSLASTAAVQLDTSSVVSENTPLSSDVNIQPNSATSKPVKKRQRLPNPKLNRDDELTGGDLVPVLHIPSGSKKFVGAHVSAAGGLFKSVRNSLLMNGNAFALFTKPRKWDAADLEDSTVQQFTERLRDSGIAPQHILPHGQYICNIGSPDKELRDKSFRYFLDDLKRCERLGISLYNIHPGSSCGNCTREECIQFIADNVNAALKETQKICVVLENMAGHGNHIGASFQDLADVISLINDEFKSEQNQRIGVCFDTCHAFAAGYDIRTAESFDNVMKEFDSVVGLRYLKACHLNDSKGELGCKRDRHENLGKGKIGLDAFRFIMTDSRFDNIPLILETPVQDDELEVYKREIALLRSFECL